MADTSSHDPPAEDSTMAIEARGLRKAYPARSGPVEVLRDVHLTLRGGDSVAIMGPSGSGKSTLLHILGTLEEPTAGSVLLGGCDPFRLSPREMAAFRNERIGFVFQDHYLLPQCSALENVLVPTLVRPPKARSKALAKARGLLERVGLGERFDYRPADLSGGERQRVAIARALVNSPEFLFCDEPTGNLDAASSDAIGTCFLDLQRQEGATLVLVTHNAQFARLFSRVLELHEGVLREQAVASE